MPSIKASGHKFGMTPLRCDFCVWRERSALPEDPIFYVDYPGGNGVSRDLVTLLVKDENEALAFFARHPVTSPLHREEGSGFHH